MNGMRTSPASGMHDRQRRWPHHCIRKLAWSLISCWHRPTLFRCKSTKIMLYRTLPFRQQLPRAVLSPNLRMAKDLAWTASPRKSPLGMFHCFSPLTTSFQRIRQDQRLRKPLSKPGEFRPDFRVSSYLLSSPLISSYLLYIPTTSGCISHSSLLPGSLRIFDL